MNIKLSICIGWASRFIAIALIVINTRLIFEIAGVTGFAIYAILSAFLPWLFLFNLGMPAGLQNLIGVWRSENRDIKELKQSASNITIIISIILIPVIGFISLIAWYFLRINYEIISYESIFLSLYFIAIGGTSSLYLSLLYSEHKRNWPNIYPAAIMTISFIFLCMCKALNITDINILLPLFFSPYIILSSISIILLDVKISIKVDKFNIRLILISGKQFLIINLLGAIALNIDLLIMLYILNKDDVVIYSLTSKIFLVIQSVYLVLLMNIWTPVGDLFNKKLFQKLNELVIKISTLSLILGLGWSTLVIIISNDIYSFLAPEANISPSILFLIIWMIYIVVRLWSDTFSVILQSIGSEKILKKYIIFQAFLSAGLQIFLSSVIGINGLILGVLVSFLLTSAWYLPINYIKIIKSNIYKC